MHTEKPTINKNQHIYYHQIASISTGEDSKYWYIKVTGKHNTETEMHLLLKILETKDLQ